METQTLPKFENDHFPITSPTGTKLHIPIGYDPAADVYQGLKGEEEIKQFYIENGYIVQRNVIPSELCDAVLSAFKKEVKSSKGFFYRQATGNPEKHRFTDHNFMINAVMNFQDLQERDFGTFQSLGLKVLTHRNLKSVINALIHGEALIAQTMFFEGNPVTWPHQDKEYLDANQPGSMVAAWIALEDIQPGAGRFYVYPGSHKINIENVGKHLNIMLDRDAYVKLVIDTINKHDFKCVAPALRKGDVLFWHGRTIHGSLPTTQPHFSRSSFTAHYMPISKSLLQLQIRQKKLNLRIVDGMKVNFPKDQNLITNKLIFLAETTFPTFFKKLKAGAIKLHQSF